MKEEIRVYTRKLTKKEIGDLNDKYASHVKRTRGGFLPRKKLMRLLHHTNWEQGSIRKYTGTIGTDQEVFGGGDETALTKYFYEIREHAQAAIDDFRLLSDVLTEKELRAIFGKKIDEMNKMPVYPISLLLESLLPKITNQKKGIVVQEILKEQEWRKGVLEEVVISALHWYLESGVFKTESHQRLLSDTLDAIAIMSGNRQTYQQLIKSLNSIRL
jgi:hypothetical protein